MIHTRETAAARALALKRSKQQRLHSDAYKIGYYDGVNHLLDELYPVCGECGRPLEPELRERIEALPGKNDEYGAPESMFVLRADVLALLDA